MQFRPFTRSTLVGWNAKLVYVQTLDGISSTTTMTAYLHPSSYLSVKTFKLRDKFISSASLALHCTTVQREKGEPLTARLIVSEVRGADGEIKGRWSLISNVSSSISAAELSTWYYWRWSIESFFKLLKQAGHDVESWLQTTPEAILRRLLIACMACALTWRIQRCNDEQNARVRVFLTRISGRVQKRGKRESAPAILAGLSILLNTLQLLSEYSEDELREMAEIALGYPH